MHQQKKGMKMRTKGWKIVLKGVKGVFLLGAVVVFINGCAYAAMPLTAGIYGNVKFGQAVSLQSGDKVGRACANTILGAIATGDASIETAKKNGNIRSVSTVDVESTNILFLYSTYCTVVTGK